MKEIPFGECHCGCGGKTRIATRNLPIAGEIKGQPMRYVPGHHTRKPKEPSRFVSIEGVVYRTIPLTKGQVAIVDLDDYERLAKHYWYALTNKTQSGFYAYRDVWSGGKKTHIPMHREVFGDPDAPEVDHRNGNGLNNWKSNLRSVTHAENLLNQGKNRRNTSGFHGVYFSKQVGKYIGRVRVNKKYLHVGSYDDPAVAGAAVRERIRLHHGDLARI